VNPLLDGKSIITAVDKNLKSLPDNNDRK